MPRRMIDRLSMDQLDAILNALPIELIFVDKNDRLQYCNKPERQEQMVERGILGQDLRDCHIPESLPRAKEQSHRFAASPGDAATVEDNH